MSSDLDWIDCPLDQTLFPIDDKDGHVFWQGFVMPGLPGYVTERGLFSFWWMWKQPEGWYIVKRHEMPPARIPEDAIVDDEAVKLAAQRLDCRMVQTTAGSRAECNGAILVRNTGVRKWRDVGHPCQAAIVSVAYLDYGTRWRIPAVDQTLRRMGAADFWPTGQGRTDPEEAALQLMASDKQMALGAMEKFGITALAPSPPVRAKESGLPPGMLALELDGPPPDQI